MKLCRNNSTFPAIFVITDGQMLCVPDGGKLLEDQRHLFPLQERLTIYRQIQYTVRVQSNTMKSLAALAPLPIMKRDRDSYPKHAPIRVVTSLSTLHSCMKSLSENTIMFTNLLYSFHSTPSRFPLELGECGSLGSWITFIDGSWVMWQSVWNQSQPSLSDHWAWEISTECSPSIWEVRSQT